MNKKYKRISVLKKSLTLIVVIVLGTSCGLAPTLRQACPTPPAPDVASPPSSSQPTSTERQDQIMYILSPNKFYDGDPTNNYMRDEYDLPNPDFQGGFLGGDIAGICKQIPYLKSLGITSVILDPMFRNDERPIVEYLATGYRVRDYQTIDRNFGTNEEFIRMVEDFHATTNGPRINVILELSMVWTGYEHPWATNPKLYPGYYRPWNETNPSENLGAQPLTMPYGKVDNLLGLPIIHHTQRMDTKTGVYLEVRDNIAFWQVDQFNIDGFRYDSAQFIHATFWPPFMSDFRERYGQTRSDFWHIADVFIWPPDQKSWQVPAGEFVNPAGSIRMDGVYDYPTIAYIHEVFAKGADPNCISGFCANLLQHLASAEHPETLLASVDNRFSSFLNAVENGNAQEKLYLASAFLLTINRVPVIYSGNEYGIDYGEPGELFSKGSQNYHENYKKLLQIRQDHAAFRRGSLTPLDTSANFLSYARQYEGETFIVVLNNGAANQPFTIDLGSKGITCSSVTNLLVENDQNIQLNYASLSVTLDAWEPKIIQCE